MWQHRKNQDMNVAAVDPGDERKLEVVVAGLPLFHGAQVAVDASIVSPLRRNGKPRPRARWQNGAALLDSRKRKERRYPELVGSRRCRLVVGAVEVGGRWSAEAVDFVERLAAAKAFTVPGELRVATRKAYTKRWGTFLAMAAQGAFAETLVHGTAQRTDLWTAPLPALGEVLGDNKL